MLIDKYTPEEQSGVMLPNKCALVVQWWQWRTSLELSALGFKYDRSRRCERRRHDGSLEPNQTTAEATAHESSGATTEGYLLERTMVEQYGPAPNCLASGMQAHRFVTRRRLWTMPGTPVDVWCWHMRVILANTLCSWNRCLCGRQLCTLICDFETLHGFHTTLAHR